MKGFFLFYTFLLLWIMGWSNFVSLNFVEICWLFPFFGYLAWKNQVNFHWKVSLGLWLSDLRPAHWSCLLWHLFDHFHLGAAQCLRYISKGQWRTTVLWRFQSGQNSRCVGLIHLERILLSLIVGYTLQGALLIQF